MTFEATKSWVISAPAGNSFYTIYHPRTADAGNTNLDTYRAEHVEVANQTATAVYVALDRAGSLPAGTGVYGTTQPGPAPLPSPMAATPGDFDFAVTSNTGWSALDFVIPAGSQYMTVLCTGVGLVTVSYGGQM
jgi:hypothetical protein